MPKYTNFEFSSQFIKMNFFGSLQQTLDIVHKAYPVPNAIKRTDRKYNVDPNQICRWKNALTGLDEDDGQHQLALLTLFKGQAKKTLHSGKVCTLTLLTMESLGTSLTPCAVPVYMFL